MNGNRCRCGRPLVNDSETGKLACQLCSKLPEQCPCAGLADQPPAGSGAFASLVDGKRLARNGQGSAEAWEDPLPLAPQASALPAFPLAMLPPWIADMVRGVAANADTPADVAAFAALGALAAATGRRVWISAKSQRVPVNFYGVTGLTSGQRKSGPFHAIANVPLLRAERLLQDDEDAAAESADPKREPAKIRLYSSNPTPAGLRDLMAANDQRMAVVSSEGGVFQELAGRYDRIPDLDLVLSGYDGHPFNADRATKAVMPMHEPVLSLSLTVQPAVLAEMAANPAFRDRGLLARLLYGLPADVVGFRRNERIPVPPGVVDAYYARMAGLLVSAHPGVAAAEWHLSDAAWKIFHDAEQRIEVKLRPGAEYGGNDGMREWASKFTGHLLRITGLLHAAENCDGKAALYEMPSRISDDTMLRGINAVESYFLPHAETTFGFMRMEPMTKEAEAILEWIRNIDWTGRTGGDLGKRIASHPGVVTRREVAQGVWAIRTMDHASAVLHLLEKAGYVRLTEAERRDSVRYAVHPSLISSTVSTVAVSDSISAGQTANQSVESLLYASSTVAQTVETVGERRGPLTTQADGRLPAEILPNVVTVETVEESGQKRATVERG